MEISGTIESAMLLLTNKHVGLITNGTKISSTDRINFLKWFSAEPLIDKLKCVYLKELCDDGT